jgi:hypothetical protein
MSGFRHLTAESLSSGCNYFALFRKIRTTKKYGSPSEHLSGAPIFYPNFEGGRSGDSRLSCSSTMLPQQPVPLKFFRPPFARRQSKNGVVIRLNGDPRFVNMGQDDYRDLAKRSWTSSAPGAAEGIIGTL